MPELPEVEEVRRGLQNSVIDAVITAVLVRRKDFILPSHTHVAHLHNQRIASTFRHGKKLFLTMHDGQTLHVHLGMSGRVDILPASEPTPKHTHLTLALADGREVRFRDPRRFGGIVYYPSLHAALAGETQSLGPDALTLTAEHLLLWKKTRGFLKQRLLCQHDVAGLGNIYVDEALWMSHLHPRQRVARIRPDQLAALVEAVRLVLNRSIASGGTTLRDYRNVSDQPGAFALQLQAYGRAGKPCTRCGTTLKSATIATRTTVWCPACQKKR